MKSFLQKFAYFALGCVCCASFAATYVSTKIYEDTDSVTVGRSTTDKVGFHGVTAVVQRSGAAQAAVATTGASNSSPYGYTTSAQADAIVTLLNEIRATLVAKGLMKGSS